MDIDQLVKDKGLRITIKDDIFGHDPPRIVDADGCSILLWSTWGKKLGMINGKGTLVYIPDVE